MRRLPSTGESVAAETPGDGNTAPIDLTFLHAQTFGDAALRRDVLELFVAQARRVIPGMPGLAPSAQADAAHLLRGSARAIGAWAAATATLAYEAAPPDARAALFPALRDAFARVEAAARDTLASTEA